MKENLYTYKKKGLDVKKKRERSERETMVASGVNTHNINIMTRDLSLGNNSSSSRRTRGENCRKHRTDNPQMLLFGIFSCVLDV